MQLLRGQKDDDIYMKNKKIWNASRICVSSLRRGHANLLCIVPILVYVLREQYNLDLFSTYIYPNNQNTTMLGLFVLHKIQICNHARQSTCHM